MQRGGQPLGERKREECARVLESKEGSPAELWRRQSLFGDFENKTKIIRFAQGKIFYI